MNQPLKIGTRVKVISCDDYTTNLDACVEDTGTVEEEVKGDQPMYVRIDGKSCPLSDYEKIHNLSTNGCYLFFAYELEEDNGLS